MKVLTKLAKYSTTIKKSKFICFGYFVQSKEAVQKIINQVKKEYSSASHICYAYILDDKTFYFNDGGEPSGTAGKPMLGAIKSFKLSYTLIVIVRYFGGIKFGPGPLRTTFKSIAMHTLESAVLKDCIVADVIQIQITYDLIKKVTSVFKFLIYKKTFEKDFVVIDLIGHKQEILSKLKVLNIEPLKIKENQVV